MLVRIMIFLMPLAISPPVFAVDIAIGKPPGKMYDIGGYDLQMYCTGKGKPTVVIDTGLGSSSLEWLNIQGAISKHARVCSYDRAGYGWSDEGPGPRTVDLLAGELHALLNKAEIDPPYIMVGHSFGGYIVQYYAETYRQEVIGMVLVESSHPDQASRLQHLEKQHTDASGTKPQKNPINNVMSRRNYGNPMGSPVEIGNFLNSRRKAIFAQMDELANFVESGQQVADKRPLPDMPLIILARGQTVWHEDGGDASEQQWQGLQQELARLTHSGELRIADQSGHHVHMDQPVLVIDAIRDVLDAAGSSIRIEVTTAGMSSG